MTSAIKFRIEWIYQYSKGKGYRTEEAFIEGLRTAVKAKRVILNLKEDGYVLTAKETLRYLYKAGIINNTVGE